MHLWCSQARLNWTAGAVHKLAQPGVEIPWEEGEKAWPGQPDVALSDDSFCVVLRKLYFGRQVLLPQVHHQTLGESSL